MVFERWSVSNLKLLFVPLIVVRENRKNCFITILRSVCKGKCFTLGERQFKVSFDFCRVGYLRIRQINVVVSKQLDL